MPNRRKVLSAIVALLAVGILACGVDMGGEGPSKPTAEILSPASGSRVAVGQEVEVQYRATDSVAVVRVELEVERQTVGLQSSPTAEGQPSLSGILRWTPTTAGVHTLLIYAYNRDGVTSDGVGLEIIVVEGPALQPTATAPIEAPTQPVATLALSDDFSDSDSGWSVESEENYALGYEGGEYFIELIQRNEESRWQTYPDQSFSDFTAEVEVRLETEDEFVSGGLIWRWQDDDNFNLFRIRNTGEYDLFKRVEGEWRALNAGISSSHINSGMATNRLKVTAVGDLIQIYVNDQHLADLTDSSLDQGRIGLYARVETESPITTRVFFDNLQASVSGEEVMQLTPSPTPPMATLAFSDDFDDPKSGWPVTSGEGYGYEGGEYFIEHIGETELDRWVYYPDRTFSDLTAEVELRFASDVDSVNGGLVWRFQDKDNYYRVSIFNTGEYRVHKLVEGEFKYLIHRASSTHINSGTATNRLKVVALGDLISIYVNDHHLADFTDSSLKEGRIGLYAGVYTESPVTTRISFDNLRVYVAEAAAQLTPTVGPTPTVPNWPLALEDDFDDPESGFDVRSTESMRRFYEDGQYTVEILAENVMTWSGRGSDSFSDLVMEVDVISQEEAGEAGVVFRMEGNNDWYVFFITPDGRYKLNGFVEGSWTTMMSWRESPHIRTGAGTNRLRVVCEGSAISLYVNNQYLETVHDTTLTEGEIGLVAGALIGESHALFSFDNLRVYAP